MSVSEFPIPNKNEDRRETRREMREICGESQGDRFDEDRWSPRLRLLIVLLSSLVLWSGIFLAASWVF